MNEELSYDQEGLDFTAAAEGMRLQAYQDSVGVWTIGIGHTKGVYPGQTITEGEAYQLLKDDIKEAEEAVKRLVTVQLTQGQYNALVDFCFNLGSGNLESSTLLRKLNAGDFEGASQEFQRWNKAGGVVLAGLTKRREGEANIFMEA